MSSSKNFEIAKGSFLSKSNSVFIEEMYLRFLEKDPSLPVSWKSYFASLGEEIDTVVKEIEGPTWKPNKKKINIQEYKENFEEDQINNINNEENKVSFEISKSDTIKAIALIRAYRIRGHLIANLDPLGMMERKYLHDLHPEDHGFKKKDYDKKYICIHIWIEATHQ